MWERTEKKAFYNYQSGRWFVLHHNDVTKGTYNYTVGNEDRYEIRGFTCNTALSPKNGDTYGGSAFYYNRNSYNVNYYNGGSVAHSASYKYEADISGAGSYTPVRPSGVPEDYSFAGWYKDPEGTVAYDFTGETMPAEDIIVYARWASVTYTVSFELAGGSGDCPDQTLDPNEAAQEPADPTRDGFRFGGWVTGRGTALRFPPGRYAGTSLCTPSGSAWILTRWPTCPEKAQAAAFLWTATSTPWRRTPRYSLPKI